MGKNDSRMDRMEQHLNGLSSFQQELRGEMIGLRLGVTKEISEMKQKIDEIFWKLDEMSKHFPGNGGLINTQGLRTVRNEVVKEEMDEMTRKFDEVGKHFENQGKDSNITTTLNNGEGSSGVINELPKFTSNIGFELKFPRFNGENPRSWIRKCELYFKLIPMTDFNKVVLASFHLDGKAQIWCMASVELREDVDWNSFTEMVLERFSEPGEENVTEAFNKLMQHGSVEEYSARFVELRTFMVKIYGSSLTEEFIMLRFISGLKDELRNMVTMLKPQTLSQAIQLAMLQESRLEAATSEEQEEPIAFYCLSLRRKVIRGSSSDKNLPVRRLTREEIENRRSRGLCFNCDKKYFTEHKCKKLFVIMGKEVEMSDGEGESDDENDEDYQISLHARVPRIPNLFRLLGKVKNKKFLIVIVTGSTDSFLDTQAASRLGCELQYTNPSTFTVATGEPLDSHARCNGFQWEMGGHTFSADFWVLSLCDHDMILGMDMLSTLEPFGLDRHKLTFTQDGKEIQLQWLSPEVSARMIARRKLKTMLRKN